MGRGLREASPQPPAWVPGRITPNAHNIPSELSPSLPRFFGASPAQSTAGRGGGNSGGRLLEPGVQGGTEEMSERGSGESVVRQLGGLSASRGAGFRQAGGLQGIEGFQQTGGQQKSDQRHKNQERK